MNSLDRRRFNALALAGAMAPGFARAQTPATPQRGGRIRVIVQETSSATVLDPSRVASWTVYFAYELCGGRLVGVNEKLELVPELAVSFEPANGDTKDWVFKLRRGVQFSNGKSLTAADVIYSVNRIRDPANNIPVRNLVGHLVEILAEDAETVRFKLNRPDADFPTAFASVRFQILPDGFSDFSKPVGAGPFFGDTLVPGAQNVFRRNPNYWQSGKPYLDEVVFFGNQDAVSRVSALLAGDADAVQAINFGLAERIRGSSGFEVVSARSGVHNVYAMHLDKAPFDNAKIREAMKLLIDRPMLRDRLCLGYADIGNDHPIPPTSPYHHAELPVRRYDPEKARDLIRASGVSLPPLPLRASEAVTPGVAVDLAQFFAETARAAGVNIQPRRDPVAGYWDNIWLKEPFAMSGWGTRITPDGMFRVAYHSSARTNETRMQRPDIDQLIDAGVATSDFAKRKQIYWDIQELIHRDGGAGIPLFFNQLDAISSRVKGVAPTPFGSLAGFNFADIWLERR